MARAVLAVVGPMIGNLRRRHVASSAISNMLRFIFGMECEQ